MDSDPLIDAILAGELGGATTAKPSEYDAEGNRRRVPGADGRPATRRETPRRRFLRMKREQAAASQIGELPAAGDELVMILTGDFHGWDIVAAVLDMAAPARCAHLRIATLGFNRTQTAHLADLLDDGAVANLSMLVSELYAEKSNGEYGALVEAMQDRGQAVGYCRNHAKLMLFNMDDGRKIAAHGSLNLRRCNSFEQVAITADAGLHDFFADYVDEAIATGRAAK